MNNNIETPIAWLGLDAHAKFCVLAHLDNSNRRCGSWRFPTNERDIVEHVKAIKNPDKRLAVEECGLGRWIAQILRPHVKEVIVCDPRHNHAISTNHHKCDTEDSYWLAHLHRLGSLKAVWQAQDENRAVFKCAAQAYLDAVQRQTALKLQIKAHFRQWGVIPTGSEVYHSIKREVFLTQLQQPGLRPQLEILYGALDGALEAEKRARQLLSQLGKAYPEIRHLRTVPGIGLIGSHVFVAYIQEPGRFQTVQQLFRYCRLGIRDRSSDEKPLSYQSLDRSGHGVLKSISYRAVLVALKRKSGPVYQSYSSSLARTHDEVHARLNTQRKILVTLLTLWENQQDFEAAKFLGAVRKIT